MSQALYRQYRPQRFEDVVGQDVAVRTLRNAIQQDRVAHAYLFTGTKGTGKTTLAKLLAKAMNCEQGPTVEPCGTCDECVAIAEGRSMDVAEIDAASNTGIDHVRDKIIDTVAFQPSRGTRRVYIVDEAHQLSKAAFNALLKTIEEPPAHVLFVFCTTETHLMMATVRDRCQRIAMRSPGPEVLLEVLSRVCEREGISADEAALHAIARAANGSFRNALGTLELLTTTLGSSIARDDVLHQLGTVAEETLFDAADAVLQQQPGSVLRLVEQLVQEGADLDQFARALAEHLRGVLLQLHGVGDAAGVADAERLRQQAATADERRVLGAIDCLSDAATRMRIGSDPRIALETALVRACEGLGLPLLALRIDELEHRLSGAATPPRPAVAATRQAVSARAAGGAAPASAAPAPAAAAPPKAASAATSPAPAAKPAPAPAPAAAQPMADSEVADVAAWWPQVVSRFAESPAFRVLVQQLEPGQLRGEHLQLRSEARLPPSSKLQDALSKAIREITGRKLRVELLDGEPSASTPAPAPAPPPAPAPDMPAERSPDAAPEDPPSSDPDEGLANLMTIFDATPVAAAGAEDDER